METTAELKARADILMSAHDLSRSINLQQAVYLVRHGVVHSVGEGLALADDERLAMVVITNSQISRDGGPIPRDAWFMMA